MTSETASKTICKGCPDIKVFVPEKGQEAWKSSKSEDKTDQVKEENDSEEMAWISENGQKRTLH
jgi:hypothetical protein